MAFSLKTAGTVNRKSSGVAARTAIAIRIAELSGRPWTQKQRWGTWKWQDLKPIGHEYQELTYKSGATNIQPHAFHNADLSEDESALNGQAVVLLYHPTVVAWGNADGGHYETKKIWRKAVVCLRASNDATTAKC